MDTFDFPDFPPWSQHDGHNPIVASSLQYLDVESNGNQLQLYNYLVCKSSLEHHWTIWGNLELQRKFLPTNGKHGTSEAVPRVALCWNLGESTIEQYIPFRTPQGGRISEGVKSCEQHQRCSSAFSLVTVTTISCTYVHVCTSILHHPPQNDGFSSGKGNSKHVLRCQCVIHLPKPSQNPICKDCSLGFIRQSLVVVPRSLQYPLWNQHPPKPSETVLPHQRCHPWRFDSSNFLIHWAMLV